MDQPCVHGCKGFCNALAAAEHREEETLQVFREYAAECDYPDIRALLNELVLAHERALERIHQKRSELDARFDATDGINGLYA
jgi:rubrerythrin